MALQAGDCTALRPTQVPLNLDSLLLLVSLSLQHCGPRWWQLFFKSKMIQNFHWSTTPDLLFERNWTSCYCKGTKLSVTTVWHTASNRAKCNRSRNSEMFFSSRASGNNNTVTGTIRQCKHNFNFEILHKKNPSPGTFLASSLKCSCRFGLF